MIAPTASFKENLALLPSIEKIAGLDLQNQSGTVIASIENAPGKQGSLAVYHYLFQNFGKINAQAATHGLTVFAEHTQDARNRPGAHPNIDRLFDIVAQDSVLDVKLRML